MTNLSNGEIRRGMRASAQATNPSTNWATLAVSLARVKEVLYEELKCTLVVLTGEQDIYEYSGVDLTLPGGGKRHFLGAMPERGDLCYVTWAARESSGTASARTPVILGWVPQAAWMGHEWIPHQAMSFGEGLDTVRDRTVAAGTFERVRHKLRHLGPGNVLLSSSQGSDLVLDDGVLLTNRRANEISLRDSDQAVVVRSLQQYHAMAGVRTYGGMVAREAQLLPSTMFSDGVYWDAPRQVDSSGFPLPSGELGSDERYPREYLQPGLIFRRSAGDPRSAFEEAREATLNPRLDPFDFLQWGGFITTEGYRNLGAAGADSSAVYGGKVLYRVGLNPAGQTDNAVVSHLEGPDANPPESLTEYRVEVSHTANGTLPVTEQTDGFDAERLPSESPNSGNPLSRGRTPFVEWVLGSVVGNDPFSYTGRTLYGLPLSAQVFTPQGALSPGLVPAVGAPVKDHAATLLRVASPFPGPGGTYTSSFTSFTKDGRFRAYLGGGPISAEVACVGDLALSVGGVFELTLNGGIRINGHAGPGNLGLQLGSSSGAVHIHGGGQLQAGDGPREAAPNSLENTSPSVLIEGTQHVALRSAGEISLQAPTLSLTQAATLQAHAQTLLSLSSGQRMAVTAQTLDRVISGAENSNYGGPAGGDPTAGPSRSTVFSSTPATGSTGGVTDKYRMVFGDRLEEFSTRGNHTTRMVLVGDLTYETNQGRWTARATANSLQVDSTSGITATVGAGNYTATVAAGSVALTAQTTATVTAVTGTATVAGTAGVRLTSPVNPAVSGSIMCGSDLDPLTGLPYSLFLAPRGQVLSP